ncbi:GNAT family N-acetyltransferase [Oharaeibacter diazotrophicus]|uniref:Phosphinothricin acetyltransferase n=1 Tax=Oharaeibacter diazotrophicus TaxID=1920512 RepID=A0A4R6RB47_9HYPH|nr:GNAT family N-acetyltransferase [Oharaeibacter diazotrophicus]TDP83361.1 phosphinothricin acetyltransferase [Oharaeibacter diazotrophicus]BBE72194.1 N-acyltransferase YncA [Pleomorphomonas sp. SM30]GLS78961.1 N-acetyltransferase [Oharaeibacter diazotrophicus]
MLVRPADPTDLPAILAIYNEVIATSTAVYAFDPVPLEERTAWYEARRALGYPVLVADDGGAVVGFSSFGDWRGAWPGYRHTVEHSVHVAAGLRGRGVGSALVGALLPLARDAGKHVMVGAVDAANEPSLRFHDKLGFERVGHFREVGRKFDRWLDLVFVQRVVDA